jgi:hypothetical protein
MIASNGSAQRPITKRKPYSKGLPGAACEFDQWPMLLWRLSRSGADHGFRVPGAQRLRRDGGIEAIACCKECLAEGMAREHLNEATIKRLGSILE